MTLPCVNEHGWVKERELSFAEFMGEGESGTLCFQVESRDLFKRLKLSMAQGSKDTEDSFIVHLQRCMDLLWIKLYAKQISPPFRELTSGILLTLESCLL